MLRRSSGILALIALFTTVATAAPAIAQTVAVSPASANLRVGDTLHLTAYVDGVASVNVNWLVNGILGGNSTVGFIDRNGNYTAPAIPPSGWSVTATATSKFNATKYGSCWIVVRNRAPQLTDIDPHELPIGPYSLRVMGSSFVTGALVLWNGSPVVTTFNSPTLLTATGNAPSPGVVTITVANPGPDALSAPLSLTVRAASPTPLAATATPSRTVTLAPTASRTFTASLTPTRTVTLSVTPTRTVTSSPTLTGTFTLSPTPTRTLTLSPTPASTFTSSSTPTPTLTASSTPTRTVTPSVTQTRTVTASATVTGTFTFSPTPTGIFTLSPTPASTFTSSSTPSRTVTNSATATRTFTATPTQTVTFTQSVTPTRTITSSPTVTSTFTLSPTSTRTVTPPPTETRTFTASPSVTRTFTPTVPPTRTNTVPVPTASFTLPPVSTPTGTRPTETRTATATRTATTTSSPTVTRTPTPDPLAITHGRFLEQTSFGPTQESTARLAQLGLSAFLDEQFALPESPWPALNGVQRADAINAFFANALNGEDQLRQRVIYALNEIIVEAFNKNTNADEIVPWLQLLSRNAFGNYRTLLTEITLDGSMGKFLDLANSGLIGGAANENYPREIMQLFSIGLNRLNLDGSMQLDAYGMPIPTYAQTDVQQLALALTGWTYADASGTPPTSANPNYFPGPMQAVAGQHNASSKTILGTTLPAGQTAQEDLTDAIDIIFNHPNVGPFLSTRLIRALVTSNPSAAYIARIATVFNDNGAGVRGDLKAVVRAILLDAEARDDAPPMTFGRLRTPMQQVIALTRALNLAPGPADQFAYQFYYMDEGLLDAPSVFGHYSPMYRLPRLPLYAPEFQIYSMSDAITRANFVYSLLYQYPTNPALQPFLALAADDAALVDAVDRALLFGRMAAMTRTAILGALPAMPDDNARMLTAIYLTSMSGEYLVQR